MTFSINIRAIIPLSILLTFCKVNEQTVLGEYQLKNFPKSTLTVNSDGTFTFVKINPNPYLHPFEHPDEYYFKTRGIWNLGGNIIKLLGTSDSLTYPISEIVERTLINDTTSTFEFQDEYNDPVPILFVQYSDSSSIAAFHRSLGPTFSNPFPERDTLTFYFYGYRPWNFISTDNLNEKIKVRLVPEFRPNYFDSLYLKVRRNSVGTGKGKFLKIKADNNGEHAGPF